MASTAPPWNRRYGSHACSTRRRSFAPDVQMASGGPSTSASICSPRRHAGVRAARRRRPRRRRQRRAARLRPVIVLRHATDDGDRVLHALRAPEPRVARRPRRSASAIARRRADRDARRADGERRLDAAPAPPADHRSARPRHAISRRRRRASQRAAWRSLSRIPTCIVGVPAAALSAPRRGRQRGRSPRAARSIGAQSQRRVPQIR